MPGQEQPLTPVLEESAVRAAIHRFGGVLSPLAHHRTLHQTLLQLFRELRRQEVVLEGPVSEMARAALDTFVIFRELIGRYADRTRLRERATERLVSSQAIPRELVELGAFVVFLTPRLDPVDGRLLAALARWAPVRAAFAEFDDGDALANALPTQGANLFASELQRSGVVPTTALVAAEVPPPSIAVIRARTRLKRSAKSCAPSLAILTGPRQFLSTEWRSCTARLTRTARSCATHSRSLVCHGLRLRVGPWPRADPVALCSRRSQSSSAILRAKPCSASSTLRHGAGRVAGSAWDRLSRAANIVRGSDQWLQRLTNHAARQREIARQREEEEENTPRPPPRCEPRRSG